VGGEAAPGDASVPAPAAPLPGSEGTPAAPVGAHVDIVDAALAAALDRAAAAGQWTTVATLAGELAARREAREPKPSSGVVDLAAERKKRGPS
jgi:hypothetical protein